MMAKSVHWDHVYEWTNYRLACSLMNARKGAIADVLDPFDIEDDWFALELVEFQVVPGEALPPDVETAVEATIERLRLNDLECCKARLEFAENYRNGEIQLGYLTRHAPFVASLGAAPPAPDIPQADWPLLCARINDAKVADCPPEEEAQRIAAHRTRRGRADRRTDRCIGRCHRCSSGRSPGSSTALRNRRHRASGLPASERRPARRLDRCRRKRTTASSRRPPLTTEASDQPQAQRGHSKEKRSDASAADPGPGRAGGRSQQPLGSAFQKPASLCDVCATTVLITVRCRRVARQQHEDHRRRPLRDEAQRRAGPPPRAQAARPGLATHRTAESQHSRVPAGDQAAGNQAVAVTWTRRPQDGSMGRLLTGDRLGRRRRTLTGEAVFRSLKSELGVHRHAIRTVRTANTPGGPRYAGPGPGEPPARRTLHVHPRNPISGP